MTDDRRNSITGRDYLARQYGTDEALQIRIETHRRYGVAHQDVFETICHAGLARSASPAHILDIGAGTGNWYGALRRLLPSKTRYIGIDQSSGMVSRLQEMAAGDPWAEVMTADAQALPFTDHSFDWVGAHYMLYHVPRIQEAIHEAWRVLKPGGLLMAATNGAHQYQEFTNLRDQVLQHLGLPPVTVQASRFDLESGLEYFPVPPDIVRWPSGFVFDQAEPALRYLQSGSLFGELTQHPDLWQAALNLCRDAIESEILHRGCFSVHSETGIFIAVKPG